MATSSGAAPASPRVRRVLSFFLPDFPVLRQYDVQVLLASRALSVLGTSTLSYGAMVHLARSGESQIEVTLLSASGSAAALIFGLWGGTVADSLSKRVALAFGYALQAALCFAVPTYFGTKLAALLGLVFAVSILTQITSPAVKAAVRLVASAPELATAAMLLTMAGAVGSGGGSAVLAPLLMKLWNVKVLMYVCGGVFTLSAVRAIRLPGEARKSRGERRQRTQSPGLRQSASWILAHRAVATMILSGAIVAVLSDVTDALQPVYVRSVLHADPANSIYIFAPGAIGSLIGTVLAPLLMRWPGERWLAILALIAFTAAAVLWGLIDHVTSWLAPRSPLQLLEWVDITLSDPILAAGMIAIPAKFGVASASAAVQTYINRRVPLVNQGSTFGMQTTLQHGLSIPVVLALGGLATEIGTEAVFIIAPPIVVGAVIWLIRRSYRVADEPVPGRFDVLSSFWEEPAR